MRTILLITVALLFAGLLALPAAAQNIPMGSWPVANNVEFVRATSDTSAPFDVSGANLVYSIFVCTDTFDVVRELQYRENANGTWTEVARDSMVQLAASGTTLYQDEFAIRTHAADSYLKSGQLRWIWRWKDHANNGTGGTFREIIKAAR